MKLNVHILLNIHWDREWFLTAESSRPRLYGLFKEAFQFAEKNSLPLTLDGQILCLEDFLEIASSEEREWTLNLIKRGLVHIGPLYVQPDLTIPSGELMLANLTKGIRKRRELGLTDIQQFAYFPDSPGAFGQLPQLLKKAGICHVFLSRGVPQWNGELEFRWQALSGDEVTATYLPRGYKMLRLSELFAGKCVSSSAVLEQVNRYKSVIRSGSFLLPVLFEPYDLPAEPGVQCHTDDAVIHWSTLGSYAAELAGRASSLPVYEGELRSSGRSFIHPGVLSSRIHLKQLHKKCEKKYFQLVEPLLAINRISGYKDAYGLAERALNLLIQNTAQDSIGGCTIDAVGSDVAGRYRQITDLLDGTFYQLIYHYGRNVDTSMLQEKEYGILLLNFHSAGGIRPVECEVEFPIDFDETAVCFYDSSGNAVPGAVTGMQLDCQKQFQKTLDIHYKTVKKCRFLFLTDMPAFGHTLIRLACSRAQPPAAPNDLAINSCRIENRFLEVGWDQGACRVSVLDKRNGGKTATYEFCCIPDSGDLYSHDLEWNEKQNILNGTGWSINDARPLMVSLEYACVLNAGNAGENTVIHSRVTLFPGLPVCYFRTEIRNDRSDQLLAARFSTAEDFVYIHTGDIFKRRRESWEDILREDESQIEKARYCRPVQDHVTVENNEGCALTLSVPGLYEYLLHPDEKNALYLTLLRSVGWTSRNDLRSRRGSFGPCYRAPEGQCRGVYHYEYALELNTDINLPRSPVSALTDYESDVIVLRRQIAPLPSRLSFIRISPGSIELRRLFRTEKGNIRLLCYNTSEANVRAEIEFLFPVKAAKILNLNGTDASGCEEKVEMTGEKKMGTFMNAYSLMLLELILIE